MRKGNFCMSENSKKKSIASRAYLWETLEEYSLWSPFQEGDQTHTHARTNVIDGAIVTSQQEEGAGSVIAGYGDNVLNLIDKITPC